MSFEDERELSTRRLGRSLDLSAGRADFLEDRLTDALDECRRLRLGWSLLLSDMTGSATIFSCTLKASFLLADSL